MLIIDKKKSSCGIEQNVFLKINIDTFISKFLVPTEKDSNLYKNIVDCILNL